MRNSIVTSPRRYRANSPVPSSFSQGKRSDKNRTRELHCKQEPPCRYKRPLPKRDARVSVSTDRQDPLRSLPNKRSRSCALDEEAARSYKRVPLIEIRKEPSSETAYAFDTKDSSTKNDNRRQRVRDSPVKSSDILREDRRSNVHAHSPKRYRRTKSDSGRWDRLQSTRETMKHSVKTSTKPLDQPENSRDSSKHCAASNGWSNGKDGRHREEEMKNWGRYEESWKGTRTGELYTSTVVNLRGQRTEGCERVEAWKLACALAHEYLKKKKYAEQKVDEGRGVKGFVQVCAAAAAAAAADNLLVVDDDGEGGGARMGEVFEGLCMDGVVNPTQAAALNGNLTSVKTCC